ncbi:TPA: phosphopantetheine-binding protein [Streptococcus agalactiae]
MINWAEERKIIKTRQEVVDEIKGILIDSLMLDIDKDLIMNDQPLFGRGLELDSIDALELSIRISTTFGVELNDDDISILSSVNRLADFVIENSEDIDDQAK